MTAVIGVAICNYNNEKYLPECLDSILRQSYPELKIRIVDDCSTDKSVELLRHYESQYRSVEFEVNEQNQGVARTRERAIRQLEVDYFMTLDSDDYLVSEKKIEAEFELLKPLKGDCHIAFSNIFHVDESGVEFINPYRNADIREGDLFEDLLTMDCFVPRDFLYSKKLHYEAGGYDEHIPVYEDWDLKIRLAKLAEFHYSGECGIAYRQHKSGLSFVPRTQHLNWLGHVFDKNAGEHPNRVQLHKKLMRNERRAQFGNYRNKLRRVLTGEVSLTKKYRNRFRVNGN